MSKHTEAPWSIGAVNGHMGISIETPVKYVATVYLNRFGSGFTNEQNLAQPENEEVVANAHLIAAAPDLLAACEALLTVAEQVEYRTWPEMDDAMRLAHAIIAKAKGQAE